MKTPAEKKTNRRILVLILVLALLGTAAMLRAYTIYAAEGTESRLIEMLPAPVGTWSLANMMLTAATAILAFIVVVLRGTSRSSRAVVAGFAAVTAAVFFRVSDLNGPMITADPWTILLLITAICEILVAVNATKSLE